MKKVILLIMILFLSCTHVQPVKQTQFELLIQGISLYIKQDCQSIKKAELVLLQAEQEQDTGYKPYVYYYLYKTYLYESMYCDANKFTEIDKYAVLAAKTLPTNHIELDNDLNFIEEAVKCLK